MAYTVGSYLAARLEQIGIKHHFAVAGDYNLVLLDELLTNKNVEQVYCSNELNCGYSAEGYARGNGAGAAVVTFSVGGLCALGPVGSAYAENLPVILISGAPNSDDYASRRFLHHTLDTHDLSYMREMARHITCAAVTITHPLDAPRQIDLAIRAAMRERKPAYIEIACNIASELCAEPGPLRDLAAGYQSDPTSLDAAVSALLALLAKKKKPLLLIGSKVRSAKAEAEVIALAEAMGCAVAVMAAAKSFFPEEHPQYIGCSWGEVSSPGTQAIVDWADAIVCIGTIFNDYSTVGWKAMPEPERAIMLDVHQVTFGDQNFGEVQLADVLKALSRKVQRQDASMVEHKRFVLSPPEAVNTNPDARLTRTEILRQLQAALTPDTTVMVETGDSWFNGMLLRLPAGARFEIEMQWGAIGWSVPAAFGYSLATPSRKLILMVGDGSFQLTAQEVAQMVRQKLPILILLINNRGYTIEAEIHDGPYNKIKNWDYAGLISVFNAEDGQGCGWRATTGAELAEGFAKAAQHRLGPTLIECQIEKDDCTSELMTWGRAVGKANARPQVIGSAVG